MLYVPWCVRCNAILFEEFAFLWHFSFYHCSKSSSNERASPQFISAAGSTLVSYRSLPSILQSRLPPSPEELRRVECITRNWKDDISWPYRSLSTPMWNVHGILREPLFGQLQTQTQDQGAYFCVNSEWSTLWIFMRDKAYIWIWTRVDAPKTLVRM